MVETDGIKNSGSPVADQYGLHRLTERSQQLQLMGSKPVVNYSDKNILRNDYSGTLLKDTPEIRTSLYTGHFTVSPRCPH